MLLLVASFLTTSLIPLSLSATCPTWLYNSQDGGWCTCGSKLSNIITCNNETQEVGILNSFCLTAFDSYSKNSKNSKAVVGSCLYGQNHGIPTEDGIGPYVKVAPNISEQEQQLCGYLNRERRLCGACKPNHFVSAYSYDLKCYQCHSSLISNIFTYLTVAYVPQTLFLTAIVFFRVSFTSPRYTLAIYLSQMYAAPESLRVLLQYTRGNYATLTKLIATVYGVWNLDFFRALVPPICLPLNTIQLIALDYLTAVYPLLLLACLYRLVTAHGRGNRTLVHVFRPCLWLFVKTRQQWNIKTSIIDAFATFILLSYMKLMYTSVDLLIFTSIHDIHGSHSGYVLYYDGTVEFLGPTHRPYAALAIAVVLFGLMFPLFLLLYPIVWFQKLLNKLHINSPGVRMFVECLQGYYRDRSDGGLECRYLSALKPLFRFIGPALYALTRNFILFPILLLVAALNIAICAVVRPYKKQYDMYNNLEVLLWLSIVGFIAGIMIYALQFDHYGLFTLVFGKVMAVFFPLVPLLYFAALLISWTKQKVIFRLTRPTTRMTGYANLSVSKDQNNSVSGSVSSQ